MSEVQRQKIDLTNPDGSVVQADVLLHFTMKQTGKDYIIYTFNEKDQNGMMTIYTSVASNVNGAIVLSKIEDPNEWNLVKDVMRQVIKDNEE